MNIASALTGPFTDSDTFGVGRSDEAQRIREDQRAAFLGAQRGRALPPHLLVLSPEARVEVDARWGAEVCEAMFEFLAARFPDDMLNLVQSQALAPPALTFAAEIAGKNLGGEAVRAVLVSLLDDDRALVREGAIYGLRDHVDDKVKKKLRELAAHDLSPGVREAASDILDDQ